MIEPDGFVWVDSLSCGLERIHVIGPGHLGFDLPHGHCTDMAGCIAMAKAILPDVKIIQTRSGSSRDTTYYLQDGEWQAGSTSAVAAFQSFQRYLRSLRTEH